MKKTYEKPKVTKVELRPEEAALTACKMTGALGGCACHPLQAAGPECKLPAS